MTLDVRQGDRHFCICHYGHEHDRIYTENVVEYLSGQDVRCKVIELTSPGPQPALNECLDDNPFGVLGFNSQLDHSWLQSGSFLEAAAGLNIPVVQWILDHPSFRWPEFIQSTALNSRFLLNTRASERYFRQFCLPGAESGIMGGVGPNKRSRVDAVTSNSFCARPINCLIAISFRRNERTIDHTLAEINDLDRHLAEAVNAAVMTARYDLTGPLEDHLVAALAKFGHPVNSNRAFHQCFRVVEESVQAFRRLKIFETARSFPILVQSDESALPIFEESLATFEANVSMSTTLERMPATRAVLSVSYLNDMIHDRTQNGLNACCVAIVEDNAAHRGLLEHGHNALLFRYDDDSLNECFDIVCNQPSRAYEIAEAGMRLRDDPRIRFGEFHQLLDLVGAETDYLPNAHARTSRETC